jgi:uncharacterized protein YjbI with pentapeptide repeats
VSDQPQGIRVFTTDEKRRLIEQVFRDVDLGGVDLTHANLAGSLFEDCVLSGSDFRGADLRAVRFLRCDLRDARFGGARLGDNDFTGSCLARAYGLSLPQVQFVTARGGTFVDWDDSAQQPPETD